MRIATRLKLSDGSLGIGFRIHRGVVIQLRVNLDDARGWADDFQDEAMGLQPTVAELEDSSSDAGTIIAATDKGIHVALEGNAAFLSPSDRSTASIRWSLPLSGNHPCSGRVRSAAGRIMHIQCRSDRKRTENTRNFRFPAPFSDMRAKVIRN